ncbi:hypothetical protein [Micropruina sp.]|uniref:hypothetical protein n=1 Tax=Micropruina sp. TaxID=2737536 RepID=UPI0039E6DA9A
MDKKSIDDTSRTLRELLLEPPYATRWQRHIARRQSHALHQSAICQVIAEYLWANDLQPAGDGALPRKLKDRVYRALGGQSLSLGTLRWFIEAFEMTPEHTATLLRLAGPQASGGTVIGGSLVSPGTLPPRRHRTVSLHEWHRVGPDGLPESHRTVHVIRAVERLDRYPYVFDTDAATVRVVHGGRSGKPYALDNGLYAVDIMPTTPLEPGQTASMEYETTFWYRTPPPQEFRRASTGRIENLDLRVQFHPLRLPVQVWWSEWPALDQQPSMSEPVALDSDKCAHRYLDAIESTVVGFRWQIVQRR